MLFFDEAICKCSLEISLFHFDDTGAQRGLTVFVSDKGFWFWGVIGRIGFTSAIRGAELVQQCANVVFVLYCVSRVLSGLSSRCGSCILFSLLSLRFGLGVCLCFPFGLRFGLRSLSLSLGFFFGFKALSVSCVCCRIGGEGRLDIVLGAA